MTRLLILLFALALPCLAEVVEIRNRYPLHGVKWLGGGGSVLSCRPDADKAAWELDRSSGGSKLVLAATGEALGVREGKLAAVPAADAAIFMIEPADSGYVRLRHAELGLLHNEALQGQLEIGGGAEDHWWSGHWMIVQREPVATVISPGEKTVIEISLANGAPEFSVRYGGEAIVLPSPLGFEFAGQDPLAGPFRVAASVGRDLDETWSPVWGQKAQIRNHCREHKVVFEELEGDRRKLALVFRAYDDGAAFRYLIEEGSGIGEFEITNELTTFHLANDADAWWCPLHFNSYERDYNETRLSEAAPQGMSTPATFRTDSGVHYSLHEAALVDWAGMKLKSYDPVATQSLKADLVPWMNSEVRVKGKAPHRSPWRTIQLSGDAGGLVESSLILNLNDPCEIEDTSWIKPSKFMGIWWGMICGTWSWDYQTPGKHGATTERAKRYIDACADLGIEGLLVEGWCEGWGPDIPSWRNMRFAEPTEDFDIREVARYGHEKGVLLVGHHETGGDIPNYVEQAREGFQLYKDLGMNSVKSGYVTGDIPVFSDTPAGREHHHGQYMVRHYQANVELAAEYGIMIDAHEPIKATGISRTWPNFIAREGARGGEFNCFVGNPPRHVTILPFTRILGGPMDYTPGLFDCAFNPEKPFSTRASQLALFVVLWSPLQMAADHYQCYEGEPATQFIRNVPVGNWDETRVVDARIGDYVVTARRKGDRWYVGAVTDEHERTIVVPLDFLDKNKSYVANVYADGNNAHFRTNPHEMDIRQVEFEGGGSLELVLKPGGGAAVEIHLQSDPLEMPSGDAGTIDPEGKFLLRAKHTDLVLTPSDAGVVQGGVGESGAQVLRFKPARDGALRIFSGDRVLTFSGGDAVQLAPSGSDESQLWMPEHIAGTYYRFRNVESGMLLGVVDGSYEGEARVGVANAAHQPWQVWWIDPVENHRPPAPTGVRIGN